MATEPKDIDLALHPDQFYYEAPNSKHRFALNSTNMIQLQLYLAVGRGLPAEGTNFEVKYPGSNVKPYFDPPSLPNWYQDTKANFITIHKHSVAFHDQTLPRIFIFAGHVSNHAESVQENLFALGAQITTMIAGITDKKVIGNCKAICKELKSDAAEMSKEAEFLHTALYLFNEATDDERKQNEKLYVILDKEVPLMEKTHDALLGDIAGLIAKIAKHNTEYSNYCIAASVTPLFLLAPPAGFIAALAMASIWGTKATELKTLLDEEVEKLATTETTEHDQYKAYFMLTDLRSSTRQVSSVIKVALKVLRDMQLAFSNMENDFDSILDRITKIENGIDQPDLWETTLSPQKLKVVVEKWKKVQNCADEFRTVGETNVGT